MSQQQQHELTYLHAKLDTVRTALSEIRDLVGHSLTQREADTVDYLSRQVNQLIGTTIDERKKRHTETDKVRELERLIAGVIDRCNHDGYVGTDGQFLKSLKKAVFANKVI